MKRQVPGLAETARDSRPEIPDGIFLVRVDGAGFRWHARKPLYVLRLSILEPRTLAGQSIVGRLYCTQKAMWKLGWFLRDFLYDPELLAHEQVDEKALSGLRGGVKISHTVLNGISLINLDGFAPASQWEELSAAPVSSVSRSNTEEATRRPTPTPRSASTLAARAGTDIATSTVGRKKPLVLPCFSAEPLNRPSRRFFAGKTRPLCCSSSGAYAKTWV